MFNAQAELTALRARRAAARRAPWRGSRLRRYRAELVALRRAGASYPELADWLRRERRCKVHHTTVMRFLKGLPELAPDADGLLS